MPNYLFPKCGGYMNNMKYISLSFSNKQKIDKKACESINEFSDNTPFCLIVLCI